MSQIRPLRRWQPREGHPVGDAESAHIVYIVTHPLTATVLLKGQLRYMRQAGFRVSVVTAAGDGLESLVVEEDVTVYRVPFERDTSCLNDIKAIVLLYRLLRRIQPDIVNASTTKAGLLGTVAARLARVPIRIYTLRGLRLETFRGLRRRLFTITELVCAACANRVLCVSESLQREFERLGICDPIKLVRCGDGMSNGVDVARFSTAADDRHAAGSLKEQLKIPQDNKVIGYVGRLTRDKGLFELVEAYRLVERRGPGTTLLLVGDYEPGSNLPQETLDYIGQHPQIIKTGFVDPAPYFAVMDVFALASHREGFPNAPMEAAAAALPVVGFSVTGTVDAVVDGETGTLVPLGDIYSFSKAIERYLRDLDLAYDHGLNARERVRRCYQQQDVWHNTYQLYVAELKRAGKWHASLEPHHPPQVEIAE